ncbi:hypothetical protein HRH25_23445 [Flavisolibacter sp. BT320]|nr:hypothetical protein [Flavisolibacter longurius]
MKKLATVFLLLLYFTFSAGATFHLHYCMGEYVSFSLTDTNEGTCEKCGMIETGSDNNCCNDVPITAKITDDHQSSPADCCIQMPVFDAAPSFDSEVQLQVPPSSNPNVIHELPPGNPSLPLFLQHRRIRI